MIKKSNLYSDQSSSSRIERLRKETLDAVKKTYVDGFNQKNNTDNGIAMNSLAKLRGSGYVVPNKITHKNY